MKSKEFITESIITEDEFKRYLDIIKRDCQPYLQQNSQPITKPLLRGMKENKPLIKKEVRKKNRKTLDTHSSIHKVVNKAFVENFGVPFRNALFVTGSTLEAGGYGNRYIIFPIGEFKYIWSEEVKDLYVILARKFDQIPNKKILNQIYEYFKDPNLYKSTDLDSAIESGSEIMIWCDSYYAISKKIFISDPKLEIKAEGYLNEK